MGGLLLIISNGISDTFENNKYYSSYLSCSEVSGDLFLEQLFDVI